MSAVKEFAEFSSLPLLQPENLKDPEFIINLKSLNADLFIVVAFRMLPEDVWRIPSIGTINLHASLLPDYRGAAPINRAIINGETTTGVTTFFIDDKIDTGRILLREETQIYPFENAGDLHDRLKVLGSRLVIKTINEISENKVTPLSQNELESPGVALKQAPKIHPQDCIINWNNNTTTVHNLIRGLSPYPGARSVLTSGTTRYSFKVLESQMEICDHDLQPGHLLSDGKNYLKVACKDGFITIIKLQIEGKKRMNTLEFLRGFSISSYTIPVS
jgi:methionyl-tRNA formyltransferase